MNDRDHAAIDEALEALMALLAEEQQAIRAMDARRVAEIADEKVALSKIVVFARGRGDAGVRPAAAQAHEDDSAATAPSSRTPGRASRTCCRCRSRSPPSATGRAPRRSSCRARACCFP